MIGDNIFSGDRSYKRDICLQFRSNRTGKRYESELDGGRIGILTCILILHLLQVIVDYFSVKVYGEYMILTLWCLLLSFYCIRCGYNMLVIRLLIMIISIYFELQYMYAYTYDTAILLIQIQILVMNILTTSKWIYQVLLMCYSTSISQKSYKNNRDFLMDLLLSCPIIIVCGVIIEKILKDNWIQLNSLKKSEYIFRSLFDNMNEAIFITDFTKSKRVLYHNRKADTLLSQYATRQQILKKKVVLVSLFKQQSIKYIEEIENYMDTTQQIQVVLRDIENDDQLTQTNEQYYVIQAKKVQWKGGYALMIQLRENTIEVNKNKLISKLGEEVILNINKRINTQNNIKELWDFRHLLMNQYEIINQLNYITSKIFQVNFNLKECIVSTIDTIVSTHTDSQYQVNLKFEQSFPDYVSGDAEKFRLLLYNILENIIIKQQLQEAEKELKITCELKKFIENGFLLEISFTFQKTSEFTDILQKLQHYGLDQLLTKNIKELGLLVVSDLVELLNGNILLDENTMQIKVEIPFDPQSNNHSNNKQQQHLLYIPCKDLRLVECRQDINQNNIKWAKNNKQEKEQEKVSEKEKEKENNKQIKTSQILIVNQVQQKRPNITQQQMSSIQSKSIKKTLNDNQAKLQEDRNIMTITNHVVKQKQQQDRVYKTEVKSWKKSPIRQKQLQQQKKSPAQGGGVPLRKSIFWQNSNLQQYLRQPEKKQSIIRRRKKEKIFEQGIKQMITEYQKNKKLKKENGKRQFSIIQSDDEENSKKIQKFVLIRRKKSILRQESAEIIYATTKQLQLRRSMSLESISKHLEYFLEKNVLKMLLKSSDSEEETELSQDSSSTNNIKGINNLASSERIPMSPFIVNSLIGSRQQQQDQQKKNISLQQYCFQKSKSRIYAGDSIMQLYMRDEGLRQYIQQILQSNSKRRWCYVKQQETNYQYQQVYTVLGVDDTQFHLEILQTVAKTVQIQLETACSGEDAVKMVKDKQQQGLLYNLILMDIIMPDIDGYQATKEIRSLEQQFNMPKTYIVGLTADYAEDVKVNALKYGMNQCTYKPLKAEQLKKIIEWSNQLLLQ